MNETVDWTSEAAWTHTRRPVEAASALPAACYTDTAFFALEQDLVFSRSWICIGTVDELAVAPDTNPTDARSLVVREVAGRSIIVTRSGDGELRGFYNSCRHRGTQLAECDGTIASVIRCPYHRWGYDLDGHLIATPRFADIAVADFDPADYSLRSVRVATAGCLLFACLSDDAPPLDEWLGDLGERLAGYRLDGWATRERTKFTIEANWKLISENFQEYYHLPWVHPELAKVSRVDDHYRYQGPGLYCGQCTTPVSSDKRDDWTALPPAASLSPSDGASGRFIAIFPNVLLSVLPNHAFVMVLDPVAPGRTIESATWLLPPNSDPSDEQFAATRQFWTEVNGEDIEIVERGQRGLSKGLYTAGRLSPRFEEPLHRFHNMLADRFNGIWRIPAGDRGDDHDLYGSGINPLPWSPPAAPKR